MWNFSLQMITQVILRVTLSSKSSDKLVGGREPPEIHIQSSNPGKSNTVFPGPEHRGHLNTPHHFLPTHPHNAKLLTLP